jgi:EAL domain-containing protein (putative c-di-GMP-specific phosphodiesterase class I)
MDTVQSTILVVNDDLELLELLRPIHEVPSTELSRVSTLADLPAQLSDSRGVVLLNLRPRNLDPIGALRTIASIDARRPVVLLGDVHTRLMQSVRQLAANLGLDRLVCVHRPIASDRLRGILLRLVDNNGEPTLAELTTALQEHQLALHYQPKVDCRTGHPTNCVEALVRWNHPELGMLRARQFMPLAQDVELQCAVADFTLTEAIRQLGMWRNRGLELGVSVNLAPRLLKDSGFPERLLRILCEFDVSPSRLILEVKESASLGDRDLCLDIFTQLRLAGVGLALDNFGSGLSSLTELYRMPFTEVNLDRALVGDAPRVTDAETIVRTIIALAHELSISVCAEGVETRAELDLLAAAGCDSAQGALICEPRAPLAMERYFESRRSARLGDLGDNVLKLDGGTGTLRRFAR